MTLPCAPYAAHDSGRKDAPLPYLEGTRIALLKDILSWLESENGTTQPAYWLNGMAGIGKSTIAKTVAERAEKEAMLGACHFLLSRGDERLRNLGLVLPTFAEEIAFSSDGDTLISHVLSETLAWDLTSRPSHFSGLHPATSEPSLGLTPLIWSICGQWIQVERWEDSQVRRICYISTNYPAEDSLSALSQQTHCRIAVGCQDGRAIILAVPSNQFNWDLSDHGSLLAHHTKLRPVRGFRRILRRTMGLFVH